MGSVGTFATLSFALLCSHPALTEEISVERGKLVSIIGGCHDCHTVGYMESNGVIDPVVALKGRPVGWQGPWGTTYATNLRITAESLSEDGFVLDLRTAKTLPPMPWYNVRAIPENDIRSLYRYIKSLGAPGKPAPTVVPPRGSPRTPYVVLAPPQPPPPCARDLDCGVGEVCSSGPIKQCVAR